MNSSHLNFLVRFIAIKTSAFGLMTGLTKSRVRRVKVTYGNQCTQYAKSRPHGEKNRAVSNADSISCCAFPVIRADVLILASVLPLACRYALSPEGFNVIKNSPLMKVAVAFLNVISKGTFTLYLIRLRDDQRLREKVMAERIETRMDDKFNMPINVVSMIQEALGATNPRNPLHFVVAMKHINRFKDVVIATVLQHCYSAFAPAFDGNRSRCQVRLAEATTSRMS